MIMIWIAIVLTLATLTAAMTPVLRAPVTVPVRRTETCADRTSEHHD